MYGIAQKTNESRLFSSFSNEASVGILISSYESSHDVRSRRVRCRLRTCADGRNCQRFEVDRLFRARNTL